MTAVYPLDLFATHQLWSRILVSAFSGLLFGSAHWIEWILVADVLLLVCLVGMRTTRLCHERRQRLDTA